MGQRVRKLKGTRSTPIGTPLAQIEAAGALWHKGKFCEPYIDCTPGIYVLGVPKEIATACHTVLAHLQKTSACLTDTNSKFALQLLSYVAVLVQDEALADAVGQFVLERVRELKDDESTVEIIFRLVECSSAYADRTKAADTLARRLESASFLAKPSASLDLHDSLKQLQLLEGLLSQRLGRALAAARLARSAA